MKKKKILKIKHQLFKGLNKTNSQIYSFKRIPILKVYLVYLKEQRFRTSPSIEQFCVYIYAVYSSLILLSIGPLVTNIFIAVT